MLWIKAMHIVFVVCWFAGLFYLPRLYVYHAMSTDQISLDRFKIMERKLFWGITTPSGILATLFGFQLLVGQWAYYRYQPWMHVKLGLVALLWMYHGLCWKYLRDFKHENNQKSHVFYRVFNEATFILLIGIIVMVVVRPWSR